MSSSNSMVVVVDDDRAVRSALKFALEAEGLRVQVHSTAEEALADAALPSAGCLVVDQYMPGMTGIDLVAELRRRRVTVPAVLMTARPSNDLRLRAMRSGYGPVLEKPMQDSSLLDAIRAALAGAGSSPP